MLGIGLTLFCLKGLAARNEWRTGVLSFAFWSINIGLALMVGLSDLPRGLMQAWASVNDGMWFARSAEFMQTGIMDTLRWMRVIGDTIFAIGVLALAWFVLGLKFGWSVTENMEPIMQRDPARPVTGVARTKLK
jgi:nitric oxide reductase subunit B